MFYVYVLKSKKFDWYYVGSTNDLKARFYKHNQGLVKSTKYRAPYNLVYYEAYLAESLARDREKQIKDNYSVKERILKRVNKAALSSSG